MRSRFALSVLSLLTACGGADEAPPVEGAKVEAEASHDAAAGQDLIREAPSWSVTDDPERDGWSTETRGSQAGAQLHHLGDWFSDPDGDPGELASLVHPDFVGRALRPECERAYEDGSLRVERAIPQALDENPGVRGVDGMRRSLERLRAPYQGAAGLNSKFKVYRVHPGESSFSTEQLVHFGGVGADQRVEQNATWTIEWAPQDDGPPLMRSLRVDDFEEVRSVHGTAPFYSDCTSSVLGGTECFVPQLLTGYHEWLGRNQNFAYFSMMGTPGVALGDVNGDGLDDVYLCQEESLPNRLFVQQPDGSVRDTSAAAGVDWLDNTRSALIVDWDGDRDQDLAVAVYGAVLLAENDGDGHFELRVVLKTPDDAMTLSAVDFDEDADLDLYVAVYFSDEQRGDSSTETGSVNAQFVYHDANTGGSNILFRNDRDWEFTDVTAAVGLDEDNTRFSFAAAWEDFDNDEDLDLYVANDYGRNSLYRRSEKDGAPWFENVAHELNAEDSAAGMAVAWGDPNRDGRMDLHVSNMFSSAGNRITFQPQFKPDASEEVRRRLQRFARGNTLLQNNGEGFDDVSVEAAVTMGRWAWGSDFVDLNNDGWEDVVVMNGFMTTADPGDM